MAVTQNRTLPDTVFDDYVAVLANDRRRAIVEILAEEDRSVNLRLLAGWTAAETEGVPLDALPEESIDRMEVRLHHVHLPKLEEAGVLLYDEAEKRVVPSDELTDAHRALETLQSARKN